VAVRCRDLRRREGMQDGSKMQYLVLTRLKRCRYGFEPQRVTVWIYWQALKLLWRGLHFSEPPTKQQRVDGVDGATVPPSGCGARFVWRDASGWPWASDD